MRITDFIETKTKTAPICFFAFALKTKSNCVFPLYIYLNVIDYMVFPKTTTTTK